MIGAIFSEPRTLKCPVCKKLFTTEHRKRVLCYSPACLAKRKREAQIKCLAKKAKKVAK